MARKTREPKPEDTVLWITRMAGDGNDREVAKLYYEGDAARGVYEHARRVIPQAEDERENLGAGDLLVTLLVDGGDSDTDDPPLRVPATQALWFVRDWLNLELDELDGRSRRYFRV